MSDWGFFCLFRCQTLLKCPTSVLAVFPVFRSHHLSSISKIEDGNTIRSPDRSPAMLMLLVPILKSYHRFHFDQEIEASGIQHSQIGLKAQTYAFTCLRFPNRR